MSALLAPDRIPSGQADLAIAFAAEVLRCWPAATVAGRGARGECGVGLCVGLGGGLGLLGGGERVGFALRLLGGHRADMMGSGGRWRMIEVGVR